MLVQEGAMTASASAQLRQRRVLLTLLLATVSLNNLLCPATASPPVCDAVVDPDTGEFRDSWAEDCTPNPCLRSLNPCGPGTCTYDASGGSTHHYTCACPPDSSAPGSFVNGAPTCTTGGSDGSRTYTVKQGEKCLGIAVRNGLMLPGLQALNPDINCRALSAGQILDLGNYIPNKKCGRLYTVLEGETCERLRAAARMSTSEFIDLNGKTCNALRIGSQVCVARNAGVERGSKSAVLTCQNPIKPLNTDSCKSFAESKGITVEKLEEWNKGKVLNCASLKPFQANEKYCTVKPTNFQLQEDGEWAIVTRDEGVVVLGGGRGVFEDEQGLFENDSGLLEGGEEPFEGGDALFGHGESRFEDEGETIIIDEGTVCDVAYAARQGDTCESIRAIFNIYEEDFLRLNPLLSCNLLQIGGKVCVQVPPQDAGGMNVL